MRMHGCRWLLTVVAVVMAQPAMGQDRRGAYGYDDRPAGRGCCGGYGSGGYGLYPYGPYAVPPRVAAPPRAWAPPVVVVPMQPWATRGLPPAEFVYWCDNPKGYYPYVTTCNGPWREQSAVEPR